MKKILIIICGLFGIAQAQTIGYLRYDSVKMAKNGGNTELILENATKAVTGGVLTNTGNGRSAWVTPTTSATAWQLLGNSGTTAGTNFIGTTDAVGLSVKTNGEERLRVPPAGIASSTDANDSVLVTKTDGYTLGKIAKTSLYPTWQQTLDAGSTLTTDNSVDAGGFDFFITNVRDLDFITNLNGRFGVISGNHAVKASELIIDTSSISIHPNLGNLYIDTLTSAVGTKSLRYNPTSGLITYADTTTTSAPSLTATYIGYGDGSNLLTGTSGFTYDVAATTGSGLSLASSAISSGSLATFTNTGTAAASNTKKVLSIVSSGANATASQTVTGQTISVTNTGTTSTNVGLNVTASGATNNYAALFTGRVGIGISTPSYNMHVVGTSGTVGYGLTSLNTANDIGYYASGTVTGGVSVFEDNISATGNVNFIARNTNSSSSSAHSYMQTQTTGASGGDPVFGMAISGAVAWQMGLDNSNSDKFIIAGNSSFGTNDYLAIDNSGNVGIGTTAPNASALLDVSSTTKGVLLPRMTATQGSAITGVNGLMIYVTDTNGTFTSVGFWGYENGAWVKL